MTVNQKTKTNPAKFIWVLIALIIAFLWAKLPLSVTGSYPVLLSFVGGALVCGATIMFSRGSDSFWIFLLPIFTFIGFSIIFTLVFSLKESSDLEENGILTTGIVIDKYTMRAKRSTIRNIEVVFYTKDKQKITVTESASKERYRNTKIGTEIKLLYSTTNPDIITFNTEPEKEKEKEILLYAQDLITLFQLGSSASDLLESMHWKYSQTDSIWFYDNTQMTLKIQEDQPLVFTTSNFKHFELYEKGFKSLNYKIIDRVPLNKTTFKSEHYTVILENSLVGQGQFQVMVQDN